MTKQKHLFGFRRSALAVAVALSLGAGNAFAVPTLNEFSNSSGTNDPNFLADHLIKEGTGITRLGDAGFQGNLDYSGDDGGDEGYGGYGGFPDTVLGAPGADGTINVNDDSSPLGNGLADAQIGFIDPETSTVTFTVSGFSDFGLTGDHSQEGGYDLYAVAIDPSGSTSPIPEYSEVPVDVLDQFFNSFNGASGSSPMFMTSGFLDGDGYGGGFGDVDEFVISAAELGVQVGVALPVFAVIDNTQSGGGITPGGEVVESIAVIGGGTGSLNGSASYFTDLDLDEDGSESGDFSLTGDGILLTSGVGTPPTSNTSDSFSGIASGFGDAGLDDILAAAGTGSFTTDATVLAFEFALNDGYNAVSLEYMFGTEEFPNFSNFHDVAAIFIDGRNVTVFPDGSALMVSNGTFANQLLDNSSSELDIEYDGVSQRQKVIVPLDPGVHSIKIAVSDASDSIYDTGFFVADFQGVMLDAGVDPGDPVLPDPGDDPSDGFDMTITVGDSGIGIDPTTPIWIDPPVAIGYIIEVTGAEKFATATMPSGFGDDKYDIFWDDAGTWVPLGEFNASDLIDFLTLADPSGVTKFKIEGIEASAGVDPNDPLGFPVGVTFTGAGTFNVNMSPITNSVPATAPEPATFALLGAGLAGMGALRRRRKVK
ncbi:MAG: choice-of-anchor L domain-containing protein [Chromatiaceae bacterium]|nr:choice-of-anchor L domain-containing protein [Chromatiaceae bacterium]